MRLLESEDEPPPAYTGLFLSLLSRRADLTVQVASIQTKRWRERGNQEKAWPALGESQGRCQEISNRSTSSSALLRRVSRPLYDFVKSSSTPITSLISLKKPTDPTKSPSTPAPQRSIRPLWDFSLPSAWSPTQSPTRPPPSARRSLVT